MEVVFSLLDGALLLEASVLSVITSFEVSGKAGFSELVGSFTGEKEELLSETWLSLLFFTSMLFPLGDISLGGVLSLGPSLSLTLSVFLLSSASVLLSLEASLSRLLPST